MKIWIFNHYANIPNYPGGTRHFDLARYLVSKGHQVTIFASSYHYLLLKELKIYPNTFYLEENINGINFVWIKTHPYKKNDLKRLLNMLSYAINTYRIRNDFDKSDIIIGSTVHPFAAYSASLIAKKLNVPFIFEIRDLWPQTFIDIGIWKEKSLKSKFFKKIEEMTIRNSNGIIILSPLTEEYIRRNYSFYKEEIKYIPNGVCIDRYNTYLSNEKIIENKTIHFITQLKKYGNFILMFTGALVKSNNLKFLIETAKLLIEYKNIKLILVGNGTEKESIERLIKQFNLDNVYILEPVKKAYVPNLLELADVLLLIQDKVMWGSMNKLFDYMAAGRPILISTFAEHNNPIIQIQKGIYVPPSNVDKMKNAILNIYSMPSSKRENFGKFFRTYVEKNHSIEKLSIRLENFCFQTIRRFRSYKNKLR